MKNSVADIGKAILTQPEKATIIIGYLSAEQWTAETITALLCRDIKPDNVFRRVPKLVPGDDHDPDNKPSNFWKKFWDTIKWVTLAGVGVGLLVTFGPELAAAAELFAGFSASAKVALPMLEKAIARMLAAGITTGIGISLSQLQSSKTEIETTLTNGHGCADVVEWQCG